jgi:TRAP-type C4-dicarboxylate transport system permease small subunit
MSAIARARGWFEQALTFIIALCLLALVAMDSTLVVLRYGFNSGVAWSGEVGVLLMMTLAWTGLPLLWLKGGHIAIDLFGKAIPRATRRALSLMLDIAFGALAIILAVFAFRAAEAYSFIDMAVLPLSGDVKFWPVVAGAVLSVIAVLLRCADRNLT